MTYREQIEHLERTRPEGCQCNVHEWHLEWTPVCEQFACDGTGDRCSNCEHGFDCHSTPLVYINTPVDLDATDKFQHGLESFRKVFEG